MIETTLNMGLWLDPLFSKVFIFFAVLDDGIPQRPDCHVFAIDNVL